MCRICSVILCVCFSCLSGINLCNKEESFAFTGCNAVLKWNLGYMPSRFDLHVTNVYIKDKNGSVIISNEENKCTSLDNISMKCDVSERDGEFFISVIIKNVTKDHSGNFTAFIRKGLIKSSGEKQLIVIDKPRIVENRKPVLHESFSITCNTSYRADCLTYHWIINDVPQNYTVSVQGDSSTLTFTNITMMDNSSKLKCQVGIEKCADVDFTNRSCSFKESDLYIILPYYGPTNVSLNLNESDIYLRENETFAVKCSADCFPKCSVWWKSYYINVEDEELVIKSFVSRMSGAYICIARNQNTGVTVESSPFFLHHVKAVTVFSTSSRENQAVTVFSTSPIENQGLQLEQDWKGPIIVSVFLLILGLVIYVTCLHRNASRGIGRRPIQLCAKANIENIIANEDPATGTQSQDQCKSRQENRGPKLQEDTYNTIEEAAVLVYDYTRDNVIEINSNETGNSSNNYTLSVETCHTETSDVHVTDDDYIAPINDIALPIEICENRETEEPGTEQTCITQINEFVCPVETHLCQVEKTEVLETDHTYITPIA